MMNRQIKGINRIGIISFSVMYLLLALTYVSLLPNYNRLVNNGYHPGAKHMVLKAGSNIRADRPHALIHKLFYSVPENKKQLVPMFLALAGVVIATLLVAGIAAPGSSLMRGDLAAYAVLHRHSYLQYRSLRL